MARDVHILPERRSTTAELHKTAVIRLCNATARQVGRRYRGSLDQEAEIRMSKAPDVREDRGHVAVGHAEPARDRGRKFVHAGRRNPASILGVIRSIDGQGREGADTRWLNA